jgi:hypothetical protein
VDARQEWVHTGPPCSKLVKAVHVDTTENVTLVKLEGEPQVLTIIAWNRWDGVHWHATAVGATLVRKPNEGRVSLKSVRSVARVE